MEERCSMKESHPTRSPSEQDQDVNGLENFDNALRRPTGRRLNSKREGCVTLAGKPAVPLQDKGGVEGGERIPGSRPLMRAALAGNASHFLAGSPTTSLAGSAVSSLAGRPGTSLLVLAREVIPEGGIILEKDLEGFLVSGSMPGLEMFLDRKIPVGSIAKEVIPAHKLIGAVILSGNPSIPVMDIKLPPGGTIVYRAKQDIKKGSVIQDADIETHVISSPIKSPEMINRKEDLVGKVAEETIPQRRIVKKYMVKRHGRSGS
jgi:hypothetical protein